MSQFGSNSLAAENWPKLSLRKMGGGFAIGHSNHFATQIAAPIFRFWFQLQWSNGSNIELERRFNCFDWLIFLNISICDQLIVKDGSLWILFHLSLRKLALSKLLGFECLRRKARKIPKFWADFFPATANRWWWSSSSHFENNSLNFNRVNWVVLRINENSRPHYAQLTSPNAKLPKTTHFFGW